MTARTEDRRPIVPVPDNAASEIRHRNLGRPTAIYDYRNADGCLCFHVCRFDRLNGTKAVLPLSYWVNSAGVTAWCWRAPPQPRPLYGLHLLTARPDAPVIVCEGEKACDAANTLFSSYVSVTSQGGARAARKSDWGPVRGRQVIIWPDNDEAGARYADDVAGLLVAAGAASVRRATLPGDFCPKWDLADAPPSGWDSVRLSALLDAAKPVTPGDDGGSVSAETKNDDNAEVYRLAVLPLLAYARERIPTAKRLGVPVGFLDREVERVRSANGSSASLGQGRPITISVVELWPHSVNGALLLDEIFKVIRSYVIVTEHQAVALVLWIAHTYAHDLRDTSPKLILTSPQKKCGKTRLIEVLNRVTARPYVFTGANAATLLRIIEMHRPTVLFDEIDATMKSDREMAEALRGLINSGFDRTAARIPKNVPLPDGGYEPREFSTWTPMVLSGIGSLHDTVRDRSIEIAMQRKRRDQKVAPLRRRDGADLAQIAQMLARFVADNSAGIRDADPAVPDELDDRAADAWETLLAVADSAGGDWPARGRAAAVELSGGSVVEDANVGTMLLADVREIFGESDILFGAEIVSRLCAIEDRPWSERNRGKAITQNWLAAQLEPYGIRPDKLRRDSEQKRGYRRKRFEETWERYL